MIAEAATVIAGGRFHVGDAEIGEQEKKSRNAKDGLVGVKAKEIEGHGDYEDDVHGGVGV